MTPKFDKLVEGFFPEEEINHAYKSACRLAREGLPLNYIRASLIEFVDTTADADPEEIEAFVDKVMQRVLADKENCSPV